MEGESGGRDERKRGEVSGYTKKDRQENLVKG
jgi:hypothetical protein